MGDYLACFQDGYVCGKVPARLNDDIAYRTGRACSQINRCKLMVIGHGQGHVNESMAFSLARGLMDGGTHVIHLGEADSEEVRLAVTSQSADGGILAGGLPRSDSAAIILYDASGIPLSRNNGLDAIEEMAAIQNYQSCSKPGGLRKLSVRDQLRERLGVLLPTDSPTILHTGYGPILKLLESLPNHEVRNNVGEPQEARALGLQMQPLLTCFWQGDSYNLSIFSDSGRLQHAQCLQSGAFIPSDSSLARLAEAIRYSRKNLSA